MSVPWPQLILIAVLVLVNAAFAGAELALVSLREGQLQRLEQHSATGALLASLARQPNQFLATIQIGITLAGFLASAFAAVSLAEPLEEPLSFLGGAARPTAIVVVTLVLSYFTLVVGELVPKRLAMQNAEKWGLVMARPLHLLSRITRPVVWLLSKSTNVVVRVLGGDPDVQREEVTEEELRDMVALQETFTEEQRQVLHGAFEIAERRIGEIMVPRFDVFVVEAEWTCDEALGHLIESGHSRAPVAPDGDLDGTMGAVHLRNLVGGGSTLVTAVAKEVLRLPTAAHVLTALHELQAKRTQMALVLNEHGITAGLVTVEDLVEEIVGEIYDETDPDLATVRREADGWIVLPGRFPVHDLVDVHVDLPSGDYVTVAGLILERLGRFPHVGESVVIDDYQVNIRAVQRHSIGEVALRPVADQ